MTNLKNGFLAGFIATAVLSVMMVAKGMMGLMPELDVAAMLAMMMGAPLLVGWLGHFMIGNLAWGGGFAVLYGMIPGGSAIIKGIVFGVAAWLGMMIMVMPMAGGALTQRPRRQGRTFRRGAAFLTDQLTGEQHENRATSV